MVTSAIIQNHTLHTTDLQVFVFEDNPNKFLIIRVPHRLNSRGARSTSSVNTLTSGILLPNPSSNSNNSTSFERSYNHVISTNNSSSAQRAKEASSKVNNIYITVKMATKEGDYDSVREAIKAIIPKEDYDDGSLGPILVRLAWHASGTFDKKTGTGGSNGATMRYHNEAGDEANRGLEYARQFLEPIKAQFPWISYADLWTLAGAVAIEYMGGPHIEWKPGRIDYVDEANVPPQGRLPDGSKGQDHLRDIFYRMGFNDQEIVALCGAHNLGRTHANRSGFDGPWVPNPIRFSNTYFKLLLNEEWHLDKSPAGKLQYYDEDKELMMLPADYSLIQDPIFREWVKKYADDKDLFYDHFAKAFAKLLELGVRRDSSGKALINLINQAKL